jgi:tRNA G18 (ribose-2'-O)-methylase SpoU
MVDTSKEVEIRENKNTVKYNVHTIFQDKPVEKLKEISQKLSLPVHLMLLNLNGNMNIGMSIRTAAAFGCSDVWVIGSRKYDARPEVGAKNYINVHRIGKLGQDPKIFFEEKGLRPVLVEQGGAYLEDMNFKPFTEEKPLCFIMGSESDGIPKEWLTSLKDAPRITITQYGMMRSLNVATACSIILYEYLKQWRNQRISL